MRIAFVSYEFPTDTAFGGIATYVAQIARQLASAGAEVDVFCGSPTRNQEYVDEDGVHIHRLKCDRMAFPTMVVAPFVRRHRIHPFDVLEGPDFLAEARYVTRALPHLACVVKLHTPHFFSSKFGRFPLTKESLHNRLRLLWYVAKTRNFRALAPADQPLFREERSHILSADEIAAPSRAVGDVILKTWAPDPRRISLVPYTYEPPPEMLAIPVDSNTKRVSFVGRLEWRKGVQDLAPAIPLIFERHPQAKFRFVGAWSASPRTGQNMKDFLCARIPSRYHDRLEFTGKVPLSSIPHHLAETDVCVFPSRWESFGFVVLEAMSAGRGIVCTGNGGMAELVDGGRYGMLVPPKSPRHIANQVNYLLSHPERRKQMGYMARTEGLKRFSAATVVPIQIRSYERAIERKNSVLQAVG